jgi:hypothetical protein
LSSKRVTSGIWLPSIKVVKSLNERRYFFEKKKSIKVVLNNWNLTKYLHYPF